MRFLQLAGLFLFAVPLTLLAGTGGAGDILSVLPLKQTLKRDGDRATRLN